MKIQPPPPSILLMTTEPKAKESRVVAAVVILIIILTAVVEMMLLNITSFSLSFSKFENFGRFAAELRGLTYDLAECIDKR